MKLNRFKGSNHPEYFIFILAAASALAFAVWNTLLNNFVIERAAFTGKEIGILQSLREVPGFLAFTTIFVLLVIREQSFAIIGIALLGLGVALTGFLPSEYGLYFTTVLMSVGFHYYQTLQKSLVLQWVEKEHTPLVLGKTSAIASVAAIFAFAWVWAGTEVFTLDYTWIYLVAGCAAIFMALLAWLIFPRFSQRVPQHKHLFLRKRYWLYYALVFMSGARRQIFIVFAGFMMVEKFGYSAADIALLFLINHLLNMFLAPQIGKLVARWGERTVLTLEYIGLIILFLSYAMVQDGTTAAILYVLDHVFFALAIAVESYFKKIGDPQDFAATAGIAFTINHIAAVVIPALFGLIWLVSPPTVFVLGAAMATVSLILTRWIPTHPDAGLETRFRWGLKAT